MERLDSVPQPFQTLRAVLAADLVTTIGQAVKANGEWEVFRAQNYSTNFWDTVVLIKSKSCIESDSSLLLSRVEKARATGRVEKTSNTRYDSRETIERESRVRTALPSLQRKRNPGSSNLNQNGTRFVQ